MIIVDSYVKVRYPYRYYLAQITDGVRMQRVLRKRFLVADGTIRYGRKVADRYNRRYCFKVTESHKDYYVVESKVTGSKLEVSKHNGGIVGIK
jgi:hypothetical protein